VAFGEAHVNVRAAPPAMRPLLVETWRLGVELIAQEVADHGAPSLVVDGSRDLNEMTDEVESRFRDALAGGARAQATGERRALLREANDQILAQCRGYLSRPWAGAAEETFARDFLCECDDPFCEEELELTVADAARRLRSPEPVLAHTAGSVRLR
jgi:hypothetical protein